MSYLDGPIDLVRTLMHDSGEWLFQHSMIDRHNDWSCVTIPIADNSGDWFSFYIREYHNMIELDDDGYTLSGKKLSDGDISRVEDLFGVNVYGGIVKKRIEKHDGEGFVLFVQALVVCDTLCLPNNK